MNNTTELSNVLLTLLGIEPPADVLSSIDISLIQSIFEKFGVLRKIIIFSKDVVVKAFVEFESTEQASSAKTFLHDCHYNDFGKVKVFFSALQKLDINSKYLEFKDFIKDRTSHKIAPPNKFKKAPFAMKAALPASQKNTTIPLKGSGLALNKNILNTQPTKTTNSKPKETSPKASQNENISPIPKDSQQDKENRPMNKLSSSECVDGDSQTGMKVSKESALIDYGESKVVLISNLNEFFFNVNELFNVFSCFGNLVKVLLMKNLKKALVEFKKVQSAQIAIAYMNGMTFGKTRIKVNMSKYKKIDLKRNNKSEASQNFNEVIIVSNKMNRFQNNSNDNVSPSSSLIASIEKNPKISLLDVLLAIQPYGKPLKTKSLEDKKEDVSAMSQHQVVLKFQTPAQAVRILAQTHNMEINGCHLNLNFTELMI